VEGDENVHSTDRRLPRVQSPTVTLLQKARGITYKTYIKSMF